MEEIKELKIEPYENHKKVMYFIKEMLLNSEKLKLVGQTNSSNISARAAETLCRLGYVTYDDIKTETLVENNRRKTKLIITIKKTPNFQKLYDENEANRKKKEAN